MRSVDPTRLASPQEQRPPMTSDPLWQPFQWFRGSCFRCEAIGVPVALVGDITMYDKAMPLYACHLCIFRLQQAHWLATGRRAWPLYELSLPSSPDARVSRPLLTRWARYYRRT